jgi:hypothetical protein
MRGQIKIFKSKAHARKFLGEDSMTIHGYGEFGLEVAAIVVGQVITEGGIDNWG